MTARRRIRIIVTPSGEALDALYREVWLRFSKVVCPTEGSRQAKLRRVSKVFVVELRKRGWLHEEGYAPGSWAAQP